MATTKITLNELRSIVKQIIKEEEVKPNQTYMCALPLDSAGKNRVYVKVKFLGKSNDGGLVVSPLEEVRFIIDGRSNSFGIGKQYNTTIEFMLTETFGPVQQPAQQQQQPVSEGLKLRNYLK
jgi:hypothetical protein